MKRVTIEDGSVWPDPTSEEFRNLAWRLRYAKDSVTQTDLYNACSVMSAYASLIEHPAFTLKVVQKKVSGIRKAIASNV